RYSSSGQNNRNNDFSALGWVMKQRGLREAVWLIMALLVFVYLFESKRKQRIIPVIAPLRNTSLEFVKTIGRLYYQRRDNRNLAIKLKAHFLDQVRMKYNLQTNLLNDDFVKRLAYKSGYPEQAVHQVVDAFKLAEKKQTINEEELMELNDLLENFNKHTS
ncbi:MAG TPA: hypothetical protein VM012_12050, partial [Flavitalea sp.]|nr:hypothetical protein [Flavitalea sp.]